MDVYLEQFCFYAELLFYAASSKQRPEKAPSPILQHFFKGKWGSEFQYAMLKKEWQALNVNNDKKNNEQLTSPWQGRSASNQLFVRYWAALPTENSLLSYES